MQQYHTLIFDLDNTLIDRDTAMRQAMRQWLQQHPQVTYSLDQVMAYDNAGYTDRAVFCHWLMPGADTTSLLRNIQRLLLQALKPDGEVLTMLEKLKEKHQLVLASNGSSAIQRAKLAACGLTDYFTHIFISGEIGLAKPAPAFYQHILDVLAVSPAKILMTGDDTANDILPAQQCGLDTCWVSQGRKAAGITPEIIITHLTELPIWTEC
ncbi:HAD family hydrolase [Chitinophaga rhizophila]|uniref:HAD family hydrolase n=1 Tax=Chitinophaga rhizophila TaxID=2866212 RepID=A0ABS7G6C8_9BACT|nr:HAD family hydrolase [Chitinophaga rhizophila]MBW8683169.1 HAD family hydrolase [Chitinophaga rhizophila]